MARYHRITTYNEDTGEKINTQLIKYNENVIGNKLITEKQEDRNKKFKDKVNSIESIKDFIQSNEGSYYHLIYKYGYPIMDKLQTKYNGNKSNIHIIRFIQLANHVTFGGKLFDENRNKIKKSSLKNIWKVDNRNSINETYDILKECGYIYETEEGYIMINENIIVKGAIEEFKKLHKDDENLTYTRIFTNNLKDLYEGTKPTQRKQLANLFKILPFINFTHNIFCDNPKEKDKNKLQLLNWTDLARLCGENEKNVTRFKRELFKLKIYNYNVIGEFKTGDNYYIVVNPKIYYGGNDVDNVQFLYKSFEICENNKSKYKKAMNNS